MALTTCKECEGRISKSAENCPHCGARLRLSILHKWILGTSAAYVAFFVIAPIVFVALLIRFPQEAAQLAWTLGEFLLWILGSVWNVIALLAALILG